MVANYDRCSEATVVYKVARQGNSTAQGVCEVFPMIDMVPEVARMTGECLEGEAGHGSRMWERVSVLLWFNVIFLQDQGIYWYGFGRTKFSPFSWHVSCSLWHHRDCRQSKGQRLRGLQGRHLGEDYGGNSEGTSRILG